MAFTEFWKPACGKKDAEQRTDMYLRRIDNGAWVHYELKSHSTERVEWVSMETDEQGVPVATRTPNERTREYSRNSRFSLAGKSYQDLDHFMKKMDGEWGEDIYGRQVLCTKEKYPCFDSYDFMHEKRYFRWYFIREGNAVSQLFMSDDRDTIYVTEDVRNVEGWAWHRMKSTGFCQPPRNKG